MRGDILILSGVSGAGKSTLGEALSHFLTAKGRLVTIMDGDSLRSFFQRELKYSRQDRLMVSKILAYGTYLLAEKGVDVILATMLSQSGAREFFDDQLEFTEIFLDAKIERCIQNDVKNVYQSNINEEQPNLVGHDLHFARPGNPDLVIETYIETPEESLHKIIAFLAAKRLFGLG